MPELKIKTLDPCYDNDFLIENATDRDRQVIASVMARRCEQERHEWENACNVFLQVYQVCKWCGQERRISK